MLKFCKRDENARMYIFRQIKVKNIFLIESIFDGMIRTVKKYENKRVDNIVKRYPSNIWREGEDRKG